MNDILSRNFYTVRTRGGKIMCSHVWKTDTRPFPAGKTIVDRVCIDCQREERWLSLARPR